MLNFSLLQTPSQDGDTLVEPAVSSWPALVEKNRALLAGHDFDVAGVPASELRAQTRRQLLGDTNDTPVLATGHQPEFVHPGVWAKQVLVRHIIDDKGWRALDIVVDNHAPKSLDLIVPERDEDEIVSTRALAFGHHTTGSAYEAQPIFDSSDLARRYGASRQIVSSWSQDSDLLQEYVKGFLRVPSPRDFVDQHLAGRARFDQSFNAHLPTARVSDHYSQHFIADLLLNGERFAQAYNRALAQYRREQNVRDVNRPLPDLASQGGRLESPFWIYKPRESRRRLWLTTHADSIELFAENVSVARLKTNDLKRDPATALASLAPWVIRPRALTLTLWARLFVCDLFVHGIGGAKYDRITDTIIQDYFRLAPPAYACVTATLRLPIAQHDVSAQDVARAERQLRDIRYNPQRYLDAPSEALLQQRDQLIAESARLRRERASRIERRQVYLALRQVNAQLLEADPEIAARMELRLQHTRQLHDSNQLASSREYFYALHPPQRLNQLAGRLSEHLRLP